MKAVYASSKCIWSNKSIQKDEFDKMAKNARETMGGLFMCDPCPLSHEDCVKIYEKAYR